MSVFSNNTYLTDLKVGDKVIEHHKTSGLRYVSTVQAIDNDKITVKRADGKVFYYGTASAMIIYPYGTQIPNFYLTQYKYPTDGTPFNPGKVAGDAESLIPEYGV